MKRTTKGEDVEKNKREHKEDEEVKTKTMCEEI
jgi:hypothetical protein